MKKCFILHILLAGEKNVLEGLTKEEKKEYDDLMYKNRLCP